VKTWLLRTPDFDDSKRTVLSGQDGPFGVFSMLCLEFTEEQRRALHYERFHHPHPRVQQKVEALWLKSHGLPHAQIAQLVQVSEQTLREYLREYQEGGIERLKVIPWQGAESALAAHEGTLKDFFCGIRRRLWPRRRPRLRN
jgi:hypothetical protein